MTVPSRRAGVGSPLALAAVPAQRPAPSGPGALAPLDDRDELAGIAWIVRAVTHVPGVLRLRDGRLSFESTRGVLFDATPAELDLEVGRSSRAGLRVTVGAERLCVRVVRPAGGVAPCHELLERTVDGRPGTAGEPEAWTVWRPRLVPGQAASARPRSRARVLRAFGGGAYAPS